MFSMRKMKSTSNYMDVLFGQSSNRPVQFVIYHHFACGLKFSADDIGIYFSQFFFQKIGSDISYRVSPLEMPNPI